MRLLSRNVRGWCPSCIDQLLLTSPSARPGRRSAEGSSKGGREGLSVRSWAQYHQIRQAKPERASQLLRTQLRGSKLTRIGIANEIERQRRGSPESDSKSVSQPVLVSGQPSATLHHIARLKNDRNSPLVRRSIEMMVSIGADSFATTYQPRGDPSGTTPVAVSVANEGTGAEGHHALRMIVPVFVQRPQGAHRRGLATAYPPQRTRLSRCPGHECPMRSIRHRLLPSVDVHRRLRTWAKRGVAHIPRESRCRFRDLPQQCRGAPGVGQKEWSNRSPTPGTLLRFGERDFSAQVGDWLAATRHRVRTNNTCARKGRYAHRKRNRPRAPQTRAYEVAEK